MEDLKVYVVSLSFLLFSFADTVTATASSSLSVCACIFGGNVWKILEDLLILR